MRELNFSVKEQTLTKAGNFDNIISGTIGYLVCKFDFSEEWDKFEKVAIFKTGKQETRMSIVDGKCSIPSNVTLKKYFNIELVGRSGKTQITTNKVVIRQR